MFNFRCALCILFFTFSLDKVDLLENGLARTPPMGWMSWGYYMCAVRCEENEDKCLNEKLIMSVADTFYKEGYQEAGYEYIIIDDCWSEKQRDKNGRLVADKTRFPRGMKFIADYIHSLGLKFGMYTNLAHITCMNYPGSLDHMEIDAQTFADWGVDYLKVDGCFVSEEVLNEGYIKLGQYLNKTGRPMVYSCSWPYYIKFTHYKKGRQLRGCSGARIVEYVRQKLKYILRVQLLESHRNVNFKAFVPDYYRISKYCNMWRNYHDVQTAWVSISAILNFYRMHYNELSQNHGPGGWNDPDMLIFGSGVLTHSQSRIQLALMAMLSAPLLLSCNMQKITPYEKELLQNMNLISIAQDALGIMAEPFELPYAAATIWVKPHLPKKGDLYPSFTFAVVNPENVDIVGSIRLKNFPLNATDGYSVLNVFTGEYFMNVSLFDVIDVTVPGVDVALFTLFPL